MAVKGASLTEIYNRLSKVKSYKPYTANGFTNWATEAGDKVTVKKGNEEYTAPVHNASITWKGDVTDNDLESSGEKERDSVITATSKAYNRAGSNAVRTNKWLSSKIDSTASTITLYVDNKYDGMVTGLGLTSSSAALYVHNNYKGMVTGLGLTSSSAALYVHNNYKGLVTGLGLTSSSAALYVHNNYKGMVTGLGLTSSSAALYVHNNYKGLVTGLGLTSSSAALYVHNNYKGMVTGLGLTSSSAALYVHNNYKGMVTGLGLTSSSAALYVHNNYKGMVTGLGLTSSSAALYVHNNYKGMVTGLGLTSSSAALYVHNNYKGLVTGLGLTSSSAALYVHNNYKGLVTGLGLTSSSAALYVHNNYKGMVTGLGLTSSSAALYVHNNYKGLVTGLGLTSSSAALYVHNIYAGLKSGLSVTMSSATLYARSKDCAAQIIAEVNKNGSNIYLEADRIKLDGQTLVSDMLTGRAYVGKMQVTDLSIQPQTGMGYLPVASCINAATVSNNTLTLYNMKGEVVATFSKASSHSVSVTAYKVETASGLAGLAYAMGTSESNLHKKLSGQIDDSCYYGFKAACGGDTYYAYIEVPAVTDVSMYNGNTHWTGEHTISSSTTLTAYCKVNGAWREGESITLKPIPSSSVTIEDSSWGNVSKTSAAAASFISGRTKAKTGVFSIQSGQYYGFAVKFGNNTKTFYFET